MKQFLLDILKVSENAAIAASKWVGKGQKDLADQAATTAMRQAFETISIRGRVVIGEGERDEAPMLYIGEELGANSDGMQQVDIAVDPLEGTNLCAFAKPGAIATLAISPKGGLLHAPDLYMEKIAVGPRARGAIGLDRSVETNLKSIAYALRKDISQITAIILDRDRHKELINQVYVTGARVRLISDGDVSAAMLTCVEGSGVDVLLGTGGAPEGVLAAAALKCMGGEIQGRLLFKNEKDRARAGSMNSLDLDAVILQNQMVSDDVVFAATGVTNGDFVQGVRFEANQIITESLLMHYASKTNLKIQRQNKNEN